MTDATSSMGRSTARRVWSRLPPGAQLVLKDGLGPTDLQSLLLDLVRTRAHHSTPQCTVGKELSGTGLICHEPKVRMYWATWASSAEYRRAGSSSSLRSRRCSCPGLSRRGPHGDVEACRPKLAITGSWCLRSLALDASATPSGRSPIVQLVIRTSSEGRPTRPACRPVLRAIDRFRRDRHPERCLRGCQPRVDQESRLCRPMMDRRSQLNAP
jgi:hypothetical protein